MTNIKVFPAGRDSLLIECTSGAHAVALYQFVQQQRTNGMVDATDVVPGATTLLLTGVDDQQLTAQTIKSWHVEATEQFCDREITIQMRYDGEDLPDIAKVWGMSIEQAKTQHSSTTYTAAFCGFMPGFTYLEGLDPKYKLRRKSTPRAAVPVGSVALADSYCGVYPRATPGGWNIIGTMVNPEELWDERRDSAALITPGTKVTFVEAI